MAVALVPRMAAAQSRPTAATATMPAPLQPSRTGTRASERPNGDGSEAHSGAARTRTSSREIELHAGHVEIEGPFNRFRLSGGVELTVHRYHVTANRLTLERTAKGIVVDGDGQVAFCPCASPPLTVGFRRATVAPPTDLLLKSTTFRACGVPVLWLPAYWVRSPNKVGLLTPTLAWRANDGPLVGTGIHLPLSSPSGANDSTADVLVGSYLRGGVDLGIHYRTTRTTTNVRWDYFRQGMLELTASGYRHYENRRSLAWQLDALRGTRALVGPVGFEAATRSWDRARGEYAFTDGRIVAAFSVQGDVARATPMDRWGTLGPAARWGVTAALGQWGQVDSSLALFGRGQQSDGASIVALHALRAGFDARPGPLVLRGALHERWLVGNGAQAVHDAGLAGGELRLGLPLVGRLGQKIDHWLEPFGLGTVAWRGYGSAYAYGQSSPNRVTSLQLGVMNKLGSSASATATSIQVRLGEVFNETQRRSMVASRWLTSGQWLALGGDLAWVGRDGWLSTLRSRIGRQDRLALRARLEGRGTLESREARWLFDEAWSPWNETWYSRPGWVTSADINFAIGYQVALSAGAAYDVGNRDFVAEYAGAAYRHPCGCLGTSAMSHWRAGRGGWDVTLLLDLMP